MHPAQHQMRLARYFFCLAVCKPRLALPAPQKALLCRGSRGGASVLWLPPWWLFHDYSVGTAGSVASRGDG